MQRGQAGRVKDVLFAMGIGSAFSEWYGRAAGVAGDVFRECGGGREIVPEAGSAVAVVIEVPECGAVFG